jgi:hypothetical protein
MGVGSWEARHESVSVSGRRIGRRRGEEWGFRRRKKDTAQRGKRPALKTTQQFEGLLEIHTVAHQLPSGRKVVAKRYGNEKERGDTRDVVARKDRV